MCAAPTSAAEPAWSEADEAWERLQLDAADALCAGDLAAAGARWAAALRLARAAFEPDDPRLATSLANHALGLRHQGDAAAGPLAVEALRVWDSAPAWLARQTFPARARSSLFHLRLEAKHPGAYDARLRQRAEWLLAEARPRLESLEGRRRGAREPAAWRQARYDALRKVLGAIHLLAG